MLIFLLRIKKAHLRTISTAIMGNAINVQNRD